MAQVILDGLTKVYPNGVAAVRDVDLSVKDGEFLVLVGPSGCGKSTALRMVAGLEQITSGELTIGDRVVNDLPPKARDVAMVFQNYALYPHMTVEQNIGFALKLAKLPRDEIRRRVREAARTLELEEWLQRKPAQLSGGQRQRVAMGRAIVRQPAAFLMDEPLSNLDAKLRVQMRAEIAQLQRELGTTTLYVTHDQVEAMTMGDRVAVLRDGLLQQVDEPERLYEQPSNLFVAAFIGSPSMNLLEGTFELDGAAGAGSSGSSGSSGSGSSGSSGDGGDSSASASASAGKARVSLGDHWLVVPPEVLDAQPALHGYDGKPVIVGIRPEHLYDASLVDGRLGPTPSTLPAEVELREALGSELVMHLRTDAPQAVTEETKSAADTDEAVVASLKQRAEHGTALLVARFDTRSRARIADSVEVAVDTTHLHFFDPTTGLRIAS